MGNAFKDILLIIVLIAAAVFTLSLLLIFRIREKSSRLGVEDGDFIEEGTEKLARRLSEIPGAMPAGRYLLLLFTCPAVLGLSIWLFSHSAAGSFFGVLVGFCIPECIVRLSKGKGRAKFELWYSKALQHMAAALRAGLSLRQAVDDVAGCSFLQEEIRVQFRQISADLEVGISIPEAFSRFAVRVDSSYVQDTASAIALQFQVGGGEAEVIEKIARNISRRIAMRNEIDTAFMGTSITVRALNVAPYGILLLTFASTDLYSKTFFSDIGNFLILAALLGMMALGNIVTSVMLKKVKEG